MNICIQDQHEQYLPLINHKYLVNPQNPPHPVQHFVQLRTRGHLSNNPIGPKSPKYNPHCYWYPTIMQDLTKPQNPKMKAYVLV